MRSDRLPEILVMQGKRDLHRGKKDNQSAHEHSLNREIIQDVGNICEVSQKQWDAEQQSAEKNNQTGPLQDIAETADPEPEELALFKTETTNPDKTDGDQVDLDVDAEKILKDESDGVDCGRGFQQGRSWQEFA